MTQNFYYINQTNEVTGPVSRTRLQEFVDAGLLPPHTLVCYEGYETWEPIAMYVRPASTHQHAKVAASDKTSTSLKTLMKKWGLAVGAVVFVVGIILSVIPREIPQKPEPPQEKLEKAAAVPVEAAAVKAADEPDLSKAGCFLDIPWGSSKGGCRQSDECARRCKGYILRRGPAYLRRRHFWRTARG